VNDPTRGVRMAGPGSRPVVVEALDAGFGASVDDTAGAAVGAPESDETIDDAEVVDPGVVVWVPGPVSATRGASSVGVVPLSVTVT
jgi:hypothetical protein